MLKCTACIAHHDHDEERKMIVPVLPQIGDRISFGEGVFDNSYSVRRIEYVICKETGNCTAINIHMEE